MKKGTRNLLGQIEALAKDDPKAAKELASFGRKRSELERAAWCYLCDTEHHPEIEWAAEAEWTASAERTAEWLCELFLAAMDKRDGEALRRLASEVESFRKDSPAHNIVRAQILCLKQILDKRGDKMTASRLAGLLNRKLLGDPLNIPKSEDGHAQLRRLAKKLQFPLAKEKRGPTFQTDKQKKRSSKS